VAVPPVPHARFSSWLKSFRNAALLGRPKTTVTVLPPRPFFSIRSFAIGRVGTGSLAACPHVQPRSGRPHPRQIFPAALE
jgi:hypothetical protein